MYFLLVELSPVQYLDNPIECLSLHKVEGDVLTMSLNDRRRVEDGDVVQFFCVYSHDLEPFRFLTETVHSCQSSLHLISI